MEIFIVLLLIFTLIFLIASKSILQEKLKLISYNLDLIRKELEELKQNKTVNAIVEKYDASTFTQAINEVPIQVDKDPEPIIPAPNMGESIVTEPQLPSEPEVLQEHFDYSIPLQETVKIRKPTFFERHPDIENFIGENLINKIGIAILVLGIGFFVKFAIDQNWINEIGRVFIGILCGGLLVGLAHRMRKSFAAFSSVLVGGGIAIFYFTIAIAFHEYQIFSQTTAFIIMVAITGFAILLAIAYNRIELAIIAIVGGFASPFMLSTGEGNYIILFSYILILDIGMLILAYFKKWNLVNIISYIFTVLIYGIWISTKLESKLPAPYLGALLFATFFYLVFFLMNIINNLKEKRKFQWVEISILLSNTFLYYSAGMYILKHLHAGFYQGIFTISVALFNFVFAFTLFKAKRADSNLVYLLIGLVLTFVSLSAPVQLHGNYITMFWAAESVLLIWLSQKSKIKLMEVAAVIVTVLMVISLIMDWINIYNQNDAIPIIWNRVFITSIIALVAMVILPKLLNNSEMKIAYILNSNFVIRIIKIAFVITLYLSFLLELNYQMDTRVDPFAMRVVVVGSYNIFFILAFQFYVKKYEVNFIKILAGLLGVVGSVVYMVYYHSQIKELRDLFLIDHLATSKQYLFHYILSILNAAILIYSLVIFKNLFGIKSKQVKGYLWYFSFAFIFLLSAELDHVVLLYGYSKEVDYFHMISQNHKIGFPILWGIASFVGMFLGMRYKVKDIRIISLTLFLIILLKLFIFDLRGISEGGKIAAFISLGILLLIISFMYQKLKKLVLEEETKPPGITENL